MLAQNAFHVFFNVRREGGEERMNRILRVGIVKLLVIVPCFLYFGLSTLAGHCLGADDGFEMIDMERSHDPDVIQTSKLDAGEGIMEGGKEDRDGFGPKLASFDERGVRSADDRNNKNTGECSGNSEKVGGAKGNAEDFHHAAIILIKSLCTGMILGMIIFRG